MGYLAQEGPPSSIKRDLGSECFHLLICFCCAEFLSSAHVASKDLYLGLGLHFLLSLQLTLCFQPEYIQQQAYADPVFQC